MQNRREGRDPFDMFGGFGNFGGFGGSLFGRDPFDDPFFTRPVSSMFGRNRSLNDPPLIPIPDEPVIQELNSDDVGGEESESRSDEDGRSSMSNMEPYVDHPDDVIEDGSNQQVSLRADHNRAVRTKPQTFKFHTCKVTYGGVDGAYYTSSSTRRMNDDGVLMEECKEADKTTGQAKHRISRGINDKGHSVVRKLNPDGKVDTLQTLHNLNEDELTGFEDDWKGNAEKHWTDQSKTHDSSGSDGGQHRMSDWGGFLLPAWNAQATGPTSRDTVNSSAGGRPKKVVRINIE